jgi:hypothetical protein
VLWRRHQPGVVPTGEPIGNLSCKEDVTMQFRTRLKHIFSEAHREGMREVEDYYTEYNDPHLATPQQAVSLGEVENRLLGIDLEYRAYFYVFGLIKGLYQAIRGRR